MDQNALNQLKQIAMREKFAVHGTSAWTTAYKSWRNPNDSGALFAAFAPKRYRELALRKSSWDFSIGDGMPGFTQYGYPNRTKYLRFGKTSGIEPLILIQGHHEIKPPMLPQVCEEFRLYHNLWMDPHNMSLHKIEEDGSENEAVRISEDEVQIRTNLLRQYQAGRQLDLLLFVDSVQYVSGIGEINLDALAEDLVSETSRLTFYAGEIDSNDRPFSRLNGKKVIAPPPRKNSGVWPFDERVETYPDFIIGEDNTGTAIRFTCEEDRLSNYFGRNSKSPHYLTPVFFRREVLHRYYEHPEKFSVVDGYLRCGSLWGLRLDNDHPDHVMVFLGDLGRDLPESERNYWLSFNITPSGFMSETVFRRSFLNQFADAESPDLKFKSLYSRFKTRWKTKYDWDLFKDLVDDDQHVFQRLRIPLNQSQPEFEAQVLNLTKVLIDSINITGISKLLQNQVDGERGIDKLCRWLVQERYPYVDRDIEFLKRLQRLRSKLVAHRKGSDHAKVLQDENVDENKINEIAIMLSNGCNLIESMANHMGLDLNAL